MNTGVNVADNAAGVAVLIFGDRRAPRQLRGLTAQRVGSDADLDVADAAIGTSRRLVVVGADADLAATLTRLLRAERLDVEVAYVPRRRTRATRVYRLPAGRAAARRARRGSARRVTLIRDDTGSVIVGRARWLPPDERQFLHGEAVVDDTVLFDGDVAAVCIEPTLGVPGLRASTRGSRRRWVAGRAAQLGSTGVRVVRDGVPAPRAARRSTIYRNVEGWLLVR
ncbi:MAG: peptidase M50 [Mycobacterium sp.]|uniref:peptidase M50 n=1 Tax=Mycobacterium sp. TaxID=1785 RepID=UPI003F989664